MSFSTARLEGRALEHALANDRRRGVRMLAGGEWRAVTSPAALEARRFMRVRAASLSEDLKVRGLHVRGADLTAKVELDDVVAAISVDLRLLCASRQGIGLVEVKWTRQSMAVGLAQAEKMLPKLRAAAKSGRWASGRKPIAAVAVGVLVVTPTRWHLELHAVKGQWTDVHGTSIEAAAVKRKSGWEAWRGDRKPGGARWPSGSSGRSGRSGKRRR